MSTKNTKKKAYKEWLDARIADGCAMTRYACPRCEAIIMTVLPPVGETWDSFATCPGCGVLHFYVVTHGANGKKQITVRYE